MKKSYEEYSLDIGDMTVSFFTSREGILDSVRSSCRYHKHEFCELFYVAKGKMEIHGADKTYILRKNDVALIPPKLIHKSIVPEGSQRIVIAFVCRQNRKRSEDACFEKFQFLTREDILLFENFPAADSFRRFARYYYGDYQEKHHLMLSCLYEIIMLTKEFATEETIPVHKLSDSTLYRNYLIDTYLDTRCADANLGDLSRLLHLSRQQTHRVVKGLYGKSFEKCLCEVKMQKAVQLMESSELSFAEIGEQIGYKNPNSFFTAFKRYYGQTPKNYKQQKKE